MNLPKAYEPNKYEPNIYALWETSGAFKPKGEGEPYTVIMPPPNANGNLHIGHALMAGVEDILVRYHRMKGRDTLYIPGADHAGFETWVVYEKELQKQGKSRFDFTRDQLYSQVWNFVDQQRGNMELQLRAVGVSVDWDSLVFTLDQKVIDQTHQTFKQLWDKGLIYRGERMVSYCTTHQTGFADIEINHKQEKGTLWNIAYPSIDKVAEIVVATTRPETMFGDQAIAVHPNDERYKHLIGTHVQLPLTQREIPVIADEYVDPAYGTGAVKITPAHDPNDYEVGKRHDLDPLQVIDHDGTMINVPPQFLGITVEEARRRTLAALEAAELRRGEKATEHAVAHCYKCDSVIQPLIKDQWFLSVKPLAERAIAAIKNGDVKFYPENKGRVLIQYLENLHDWNLSRQIPWGIPIPAFQNEQNLSDWIFDDRIDQETIVVNGTTYRREQDTFDTWFSSGQWPFITTDYITGGDLAKYYPVSVMETGHDILYPWVSRMIMLGLEMTDQVPFKDVYLHGLVNDEHNQKMSKSKGNVINPMEAISEYGSDALRMGLVASRSAGQDQAFSLSKVVAGRNFCNKLWNIARFVEDKVGEVHTVSAPTADSLADHWIIRELNTATISVQQLIESYRFAEAAELVYQTVWTSLADWYIEASKDDSNHPLLVYALDTCLKLAHPFAPFVTETIWQTLSWHDDLLMSSSWPGVMDFDEISAGQFEQLQKLVSEIRFVAADIPGNEKYGLLYGSDSLVADNQELIARLARLKSVNHTDQPSGVRIAVSGREAWLDIDQKTLDEYLSNLEVRLAKQHDIRESLEARLSNEAYISKAPAQLVEETRRQLAEAEQLIIKLQAELKVIADPS